MVRGQNLRSAANGKNIVCLPGRGPAYAIRQCFPKDNSLLAVNPPKEVLPAFCLIFGSVLQTCAVCSYLTLNPILIVPKDRFLLSGCGGDLGGGVLAQPW